MKKKTLEEAKKSAWSNYEYIEGSLYKNCFNDGFEIGVKWIIERSYSEKEIEILLETLSKVLVYQGNEYVLPRYFNNEIKQVIEQFKKK